MVLDVIINYIYHAGSEGYSGVDVPDEDMGNLYFEDGTEYEIYLIV